MHDFIFLTNKLEGINTDFRYLKKQKSPYGKSTKTGISILVFLLERALTRKECAIFLGGCVNKKMARNMVGMFA